MKKKIVFLSLPMSGRKDEDILKDIEKAKKAYLEKTGMDIREVAFVNNFDRGKKNMDFERWMAEKDGFEFIEPGHVPVWYLGIALCNMSYCDEVAFYGEWWNARGCRAEKNICYEYDIPMVILAYAADGSLYQEGVNNHENGLQKA